MGKGSQALLLVTACGLLGWVIVSGPGDPNLSSAGSSQQAGPPLLTASDLARALDSAAPPPWARIATALKAGRALVGPSVWAAYPRLATAPGKVQAIRLVYDHDRPTLRGRWAALLRDPSPAVTVLALDLIEESGGPEELALLRRLQLPPSEWLARKWRGAQARLEKRVHGQKGNGP